MPAPATPHQSTLRRPSAPSFQQQGQNDGQLLRMSSSQSKIEGGRTQDERHRFGGRQQAKLFGLVLKGKPKDASAPRSSGEAEQVPESRPTLVLQGQRPQPSRMSSLPTARPVLRPPGPPRTNSSPGRETDQRINGHLLQLPIIAAAPAAPTTPPPPPPPPAAATTTTINLTMTTTVVTPAKDGSQRTIWEAPSLSVALRQSIKSGPVVSPAGSVELLLRAQKQRNLSADGHAKPVDVETRKNVTAAMTMMIYVLTRSGLLLQYSGDGSPDRKPERFMQLNHNSAAMASDAIPGHYWVLQISEYFTRTELPASAKSPRFALPKLGLNAKKGHESFLLIMETPDELGSWLGAIRRQIRMLSGSDGQAEEKSTRKADDQLHVSENAKSGKQALLELSPLARIDRAAARNQRQAEHKNPNPTKSVPVDLQKPLPPAGFDGDKASANDSTGTGSSSTAAGRQKAGESSVKPKLTLQMSPSDGGIIGGGPGEIDGTGYSSAPDDNLTADGGPQQQEQQQQQQRGPRGETQPRVGASSVTGPTSSLETHHQDSSFCHTGTITTTPTYTQQRLSPSSPARSINLRAPTVTGRRRSSSVQSPSSSVSGSTPNVSDISFTSPQRKASSRANTPTRVSDTANRRKSTGLRKKAIAVNPFLDTSEPAAATTFAFSTSSSDIAGIHAPSNANSQAAIATTPTNTITFASLATETRSTRPSQDLGPNVLTPPETPEQNSVFRQIEPLIQELCATPPSAPFSDDATALGTECREASKEATARSSTEEVIVDGIQDEDWEEDITTAQFLALNTGKPRDSLLSPPLGSVHRRSVSNPGSYPRAPGIVATAMPLTISRPIQVNMTEGPIFPLKGRDRSFSLGLVGSLRPLSRNSNKTGDEAVPVIRKAGRPKPSRANSAEPSQTSPRQSRLLHAINPFSRSPSPASNKPIQPLRQSSDSAATARVPPPRPAPPAEIDTALTAKFSSSVYLVPSPHPAPTSALPPLPTGILPALPPGVRLPKPLNVSRPGTQRSVSANDVASRKPLATHRRPVTPEQRSRSVEAKSMYSPPTIIETTRPRRAKVDRVTLAPMSNVSGMAGRRRERSRSPLAVDGRARSSSPRVRLEDREAKAISVVRMHNFAHQAQLRRTDTVESAKCEMEQIEEDLMRLDEAKRLRDEAIFMSRADAEPTDFNDEQTDEGEEIPIGLGLTPRRAPLLAFSQPKRTSSALSRVPIEAITSDTVQRVPAMRTSSVSRMASADRLMPQRPRILRSNTTGVLEAWEEIASPKRPEAREEESDNPEADTAANSASARCSHKPRQSSAPLSASSFSNASLSPSPSSLTSATTRPSPRSPDSGHGELPLRFSPQLGISPKHQQQMRLRSRSSPRINGHARQGAREVRIELPGSEVGFRVPMAEMCAAELTPPIRMHASVTDFGNDDFFAWTMPIFNGVKTPLSATFPHPAFLAGEMMPPSELDANNDKTSALVNRISHAQEQRGQRRHPRSLDDTACLSPRNTDLSKPPGFSGMDLSSRKGPRPQVFVAPGPKQMAEGLQPPNSGRPRWSLFGAIEGIH